MFFAVFKQHLINLFFACITLLMASSGFFIIFVGELSNPHGHFSFDGIERLMGIIPILIGGGLFTIIIIDWKAKIQEVKNEYLNESEK